MTNRWLYAMLALALHLPLAAQAETPRVTLAQVVQAARRDPPAVLNALAALQSAQSEAHQARGARLPRLSAEANAGMRYAQVPTVTGQRQDQVTSSYGGNVTAGVRLLDMNRRHTVQAAEERELSATYAVDDAVRQAITAAVQLYVRAQATEKLVANAEETEQRRSKQHEAVSGLVNAGLRPNVDAVRTEVEAISARYTLTQRRLQRDRSYAALARAMGRDPERGVAPAPTEQLNLAVPRSTHQAVELALSNRPDLRRLQATVRAAQLDTRAALMRRAPTLSAQMSGSAGRDDLVWESITSASTAGPSFQALGQIVLTWNAFDATTLRAGDTARAQQMQAQRQLDTALLDIRGEIVDASYALQLAEREAERAEQVRDGALRTLEAQGHRYEAGAASLLDLLDAEQLAQTAQQDAIQSQRDLTLARLALLSACGLLETRLQP